MSINRDKPDLWKNDVIQSIDLYNAWFMEFAPKAFRDTRIITAKNVEKALIDTNYLLDISVDMLKRHPDVLPILRMAACPPIAQDRLVGLSGTSKSLVQNMENSRNPRISPRMKGSSLDGELMKICDTINRMADPDIFIWLAERRKPTEIEILHSATIIADRLCGTMTNPIIRNAQEKRQLTAIRKYMHQRKYKEAAPGTRYYGMTPGTFSFHTNVSVKVSPNSEASVNIPVDVVIMPESSKKGTMPLFVEAQSAGDFTNVNKRRKEEAAKMQQLRNTFGDGISYNLFLCGYFDSGYLGYEAAEGIDWIWEHRIEDLEKLGI